MKRPIKLWVSLVLLVFLGTVWLWQSSAFPHTIYKIEQTGRTVEVAPEGRRTGLEVEATPIWEPDNPVWVDVMRSGWVVLLMASLVVYTIYLEATFRDSRRKVPSSPHWASYDV